MIDAPRPPLDGLGGRLVRTSIARRSWTLGRPVLLTVGFFALAARGSWALAVALFPFLFLSQVVALNDVMHRSIGLRLFPTEVAVSLLGLLVLESGHLIRVTHLAHHEQGGGADDPESYVDLLSPQRLAREIPIYRFRIWRYGWRHGEAPDRALATLEIFIAALAAIWILTGRAPASFTVFAILSIVAGWAFPLVSAMGPHVDWGRDTSSHCYRVRGRLLPKVMLNLPMHLEHHLYPEVPSHRLAELSKALDSHFDASAIKEVRVW